MYTSEILLIYLICICCQIDKLFILSVISTFTTTFLPSTIWKATHEILPRFLGSSGPGIMNSDLTMIFLAMNSLSIYSLLIREEFDLMKLTTLLIFPWFFPLIEFTVSIIWFVTSKMKQDSPYDSAPLVEPALRNPDWLASEAFLTAPKVRPNSTNNTLLLPQPPQVRAHKDLTMLLFLYLIIQYPLLH